MVARTVSSITHGVKVTVETEYQSFYSSPLQDHFVFSYKITIENQSEHTLQLLRRFWHIVDSDATIREVEGEGVVGVQPTLEPGDQHTYVSGCNLSTEIGKMGGYYTMQRLSNGQLVRVGIPDFTLIVPYRLN